MQVKGEQVGHVFDHHGGFASHPQIPKARSIFFSQRRHGLHIGRHFLGQGIKTDLQDFVSGREEVGIARAFGGDVPVALQCRVRVAVGLCRVAQLHQANALFLQPQIQCLGVDHGRSKVSDLVEMPNEQFWIDSVVRIGLDRPQQGNADQLSVVFRGGQPQVSVEAVLDGSEVIGFGVQQRHVRVNHPFKVTAHALEIGQLVVKPGGSQLLGALVSRERHVELVELDERIGQGHGGRPSGLKVVQRVREGLHGVVAHVEVQVQRSQIHKRRGPGVFVSSF